ncbi:MAG: aminotransferase [Oscillospiraceae bacterium]|nr:aminotransferase [Oscillospiraceae bacterium]
MTLQQLQATYEQAKAKNLALDMSRGKPESAQLDLSNDLMDEKWITPPTAENGLDCRNYGVLDGLPECKRLFSELMNMPTEQLIVCGNASLNVMYDYLVQMMAGAWNSTPGGRVKFLCPVPGYDRHFGMLAHLGIEMINVPMLADGPAMAMMAELVHDPAVKGAICVPKYSNPEGKTFSDTTVRAFAALKPACPDFRVIWDNAYLVHDLYDDGDVLLSVHEAAKEFGSEDFFIEVCSFSKITFPGASVSCVAASPANIAAVKARMNVQTIGHDKLNQLRHVRYFKDLAGIKTHMRKHADLIRPKFEAVLDILARDLTDVATWTVPHGGYFISLDLPEGTAKRCAQLLKEAGVTLTPAGATFPHGHDPHDRNLRIAPTFPPMEELIVATELLTVCARLAVAEATSK